MTLAISAQAASSELQHPSKMVSETLSKLPKTLPRVLREVPGASQRPPRSGPRRFQGHLSSARDLRSNSEAALKAFRARFWCKLRAPSLHVFVFSCPWPLLSSLVWSVFCCFCSTLLRFCAPQFSWPFVATEVQLLLLFALAFRCNGSASLRANEGRTKPLGARSTYSVIRATMQQVNR